MSHTPEPWKVAEDVKQELIGIVNANGWNICTMTSVDALKDPLNAARIVEAVNGCAGLNPAAYRQVVEALKAIQQGFQNGSIKWAKPRQTDSDPYHPANTLMCNALALAEQHP